MKNRIQPDATSISSNYITNSIRRVYTRRLIMPFILLVTLLLMWFILPIQSLFFPKTITFSEIINTPEKYKNDYVSTKVESLYFTGYTTTFLGQTTGYYYYTMMDEKCVIVILSPKTCEEGLSEIKQLAIPCKVLTPGASFDNLITRLADDIKWTHTGLSEKMAPIYLDEPAYTNVMTYVFFVAYIGALSYSLIYILLCFSAIIFPILSPPCRQLAKFGNASDLLAQAEEELSTLPQLATEDMFITETFFIEISNYGVAIVPIQEIIWIYKHSTLHKFFWYHFVISYTLHITCNKHFYIQCPKNIKSNIDGIMDYLAEANHNILVGFNEENRLKVQEMQSQIFHFEKLIHFLQKRI